MLLAKKTVRKVPSVKVSELNIDEYNKKIIELIQNNQDEINYKLNGKMDYTKRMQKRLLEEDEKFKDLENTMIHQPQNLLKEMIKKRLPFIPNSKIFNIIAGLFDKKYISEDVKDIADNLKLLNFRILQTIIRIIFSKIEGKNMSIFWSEMQEIMKTDFEDFESIEEQYSPYHVFFMLELLTNSVNNIKLIVHTTEEECNNFKSVKNVSVIHSKKNNYTNDGIKNLYQQLENDNKIMTIPFGLENKSEYSLWVNLVIDTRIRATKIGIEYGKEHIGLFFHNSTIKFLNERKHEIILNGMGTYLRTFNIFLNSVINPVDRFRYLLAGSVSKSLYNIRDCSDVDFFVLDHEDNIEKYSSYKPNTGEGIFDDFGKTYYGNEKFYFPMIPEMYKKQQEQKETTSETTREKPEIKMILNNYPKYSVSGLKAGRYVDIYCAICRNIGYNINNLDDLVSNPEFHIYVFGCPVISIKLEMVRDNIKDIDLGRISRKQLHDMHYLDKNYGYLFNQTDKSVLGFDRLNENRINKSLIKLDLNCYHLKIEDSPSYDLIIRRYPIYLQDIVKLLIDKGPLLISDSSVIKVEDIRNVYQRPLLSTLKDKMEIFGKMEEIVYYYECNDSGEISIYISNASNVSNPDDISLYEKVCICGNIKVEIKDGVKRISINVSGKKMKNIYQQIENADRKKEYRMMLINMMKSIIQFHKIADSHTTEKIAIDILK